MELYCCPETIKNTSVSCDIFLHHHEHTQQSEVFLLFSILSKLQTMIKIINSFFFPLLFRPAGLAGSPVISDISLIRLSPAAVANGDCPFSPPHPYVNPHMEHYLRSVHGSPTLSMISAARGLSPADCKFTS